MPLVNMNMEKPMGTWNKEPFMSLHLVHLNQVFSVQAVGPYCRGFAYCSWRMDVSTNEDQVAKSKVISWDGGRKQHPGRYIDV
jgi:hypothetical protein